MKRRMKVTISIPYKPKPSLKKRILQILRWLFIILFISVADSSLFSTLRLKIARKNQISVGDTLWNDSDHTIKKLPAYLEGSILFQLPKKYILKGTSLKMKCPINSDIYIAYKGERNSLPLQQQNWESKSEEISYECVKKALTLKDSYQTVKISKLSNIIHHKNTSNTTIELPRPRKNVTLAIFLVEGMQLLYHLLCHYNV